MAATVFATPKWPAKTVSCNSRMINSRKPPSSGKTNLSPASVVRYSKVTSPTLLSVKSASCRLAASRNGRNSSELCCYSATLLRNPGSNTSEPSSAVPTGYAVVLARHTGCCPDAKVCYYSYSAYVADTGGRESVSGTTASTPGRYSISSENSLSYSIHRTCLLLRCGYVNKNCKLL